jgi:hypothetical protein
MAVGWIARNKEGIVRAFCDVSYADPKTLEEFAEHERTVDLVEAERITLNLPLSPDARVIVSYARSHVG